MNLKLLLYAFLMNAGLVGTLPAQTKVITHRGYWDTEGAARTRSPRSVKQLKQTFTVGVFQIVASSFPHV